MSEIKTGSRVRCVMQLPNRPEYTDGIVVRTYRDKALVRWTGAEHTQWFHQNLLELREVPAGFKVGDTVYPTSDYARTHGGHGRGTVTASTGWGYRVHHDDGAIVVYKRASDLHCVQAPSRPQERVLGFTAALEGAAVWLDVIHDTEAKAVQAAIQGGSVGRLRVFRITQVATYVLNTTTKVTATKL